MPRQAPQIREAVPSDAESLLGLWSVTVRSNDTSPRSISDAENALATLVAEPDSRMLVAEVEGEIVAAVQLTRGPISPLVLESALHTSFLLVDPQHRRRGYGHALMEAAVSWAEEKDVAQITAISDPARDTNRFLARLGLAPMAHVRHTTTAALRKKLSSDRGRSAHGGNRHLVQVLAQRRSMRRREGTE
ncbi:MAG: GNAT family N-acetyltransferase [Marmoricola sp.]